MPYTLNAASDLRAAGDPSDASPAPYTPSSGGRRMRWRRRRGDSAHVGMKHGSRGQRVVWRMWRGSCIVASARMTLRKNGCG